MKRLIKIILLLLLASCLAFLFYFYCYPWFFHIDTSRFKTLTEYKGEHIKGMRGKQIIVNRDFVPRLRRLDAYAGRHSLVLLVYSSYRYPGKKLGNTIVKPAKNSNHLVGCALDVRILCGGKVYAAQNLYKANLKNLPSEIEAFIQSVRDDGEFRWGGDFNVQDPVHFDVPRNLIARDIWRRQRDSCFIEYRKAVSRWRFWM